MTSNHNSLASSENLRNTSKTSENLRNKYQNLTNHSKFLGATYPGWMDPFGGGINDKRSRASPKDNETQLQMTRLLEFKTKKIATDILRLTNDKRRMHKPMRAV